MTHYTWKGLNLGIEADILPEPPIIEEIQEIKPKKKKISLRLNALSLPTKRKCIKPRDLSKPGGLGDIPESVLWRQEHLALPKQKNLDLLKEELESKMKTTSDKKVIKKLLDKIIALLKTRPKNIYLYYKIQLTEIKKKKEAEQRAKMKEEMIKERLKKLPAGQKLLIQMNKEERIKVLLQDTIKLAEPRKLTEPEEIPKKKVALSTLMNGILRMSKPKVYEEILCPELGAVSPKALVYQPTDAIFKLAMVPLHRQYQRPPPPPEEEPRRKKVKDMPDIASPRTKILAEPKKKASQPDEDLREIPWPISPFALKYKASKRIKELATPVERD